MNVDHRATLVDSFTYLQKNITISGTTLLDSLFEGGVLDHQELEEIRSKTTDHERINQLLHFIMRTSAEQFEEFLKCLKTSDHEHVHDQLTGRLLICLNEIQKFPKKLFIM